jgi:ethanolaminephosphotransferase
LDRVLQVDLVPSLCILLGLPIPEKSVGNLLPLLGFGDEEYSILADHFKCQKCDFKSEEGCPEHTRDCISKVINKTLKALSSDIDDILCWQSMMISGGVSLLLLYRLFKITVVEFRGELIGSILVSLIYAASMGSSSFIENEHATCYFITSTVLLVSTYHLLTQVKYMDTLRIFLCLVVIRIVRTRNVVINFGRLNFLPGASDADTEPVVPSPFSYLCNPVLISVMIYFCVDAYQKLNRRKHSNIEMSKAVSRLLVIIAGLSCILICKNVTDNVLPARLAYLFILILLLIFGDTPTGILLLLLLIHRVGNVFSIAAMFVVSFVSFSSLKHLSESERVMVLYWIGRCGFYSLGNSHSIASIDISGGYTGLVEYSPGIVMSLTFILVHSGQIISVLPFLESLSARGTNGGSQGQPFLRLAWETCFSFFRTSLITYIMKNHLFVWTVFAPRLVYEVISCSGYLLLWMTLPFFKVGNKGLGHKSI